MKRVSVEPACTFVVMRYAVYPRQRGTHWVSSDDGKLQVKYIPSKKIFAEFVQNYDVVHKHHLEVYGDKFFTVLTLSSYDYRVNGGPSCTKPYFVAHVGGGHICSRLDQVELLRVMNNIDAAACDTHVSCCSYSVQWCCTQ